MSYVDTYIGDAWNRASEDYHGSGAFSARLIDSIQLSRDGNNRIISFVVNKDHGYFDWKGQMGFGKFEFDQQGNLLRIENPWSIDTGDSTLSNYRPDSEFPVEFHSNGKVAKYRIHPSERVAHKLKINGFKIHAGSILEFNENGELIRVN